MAITTFDTHKLIRRLEEAGMPLKLAEVQAEVLTEAFNVNLESLVTKDFLAARFAEQRAFIDTRFTGHDALWDKRFTEQRAYIDTRFTEQDARGEKRFTEQKAYIDTRFTEQDARGNKRFTEQRAYIDTRFADQDARWDQRFTRLEAKVDSNHRFFMWTQAIVVAAVILPYLERLLAL